MRSLVDAKEIARQTVTTVDDMLTRMGSEQQRAIDDALDLDDGVS